MIKSAKIKYSVKNNDLDENELNAINHIIDDHIEEYEIFDPML